jgi:hypothetical protein
MLFGSVMKHSRARLSLRQLVFAFLAGFVFAANAGEPNAKADVVLIVDSSVSIAEPGMDPERTSLLVTKLFADIVPGDLAVIRVLDLVDDKAWLPSRDTGTLIDCPESPTGKCNKVEPASDWDKDVRTNKYGALIRSVRADAGFKSSLDQHIAQTRHNSLFGLSFRAAQGVFDSHTGGAGVPRTIVWLSDGESDDFPRVQAALRELSGSGAATETIIFGKGKTDQVARLGLRPYQVRSRGEMMKAFARAFRRIVQAPYDVDHLVATDPAFEVKPRVDEIWVVVYGDDTLTDATIETPAGVRKTDYAQDRWKGAGAYRVYYSQKPEAGMWKVRVNGGGPEAAYAVVQRSALVPVLVDPRSANAGTPVAVVAGLGPDRSLPPLAKSDLPAGLAIDITVDGKTYQMVDDGTNGDATAGDGRFTALVTFNTVGETPVTLHAHNGDIIDRSVEDKIVVSGRYIHRGGPISLDLGVFKAGGTPACRTFTLPGEHQGAIPFELVSSRNIPPGHTFEARVPKGKLTLGGSRVAIAPNDSIELCLVTGRRTPSFTASGERWLEMKVAGSSNPESSAPIQLRWQVEGLSIWDLYGRYILGLLLLLVIITIVYGYIKPVRFPRGMALVFVPERAEVEEQTPQPLTQWKGVGIGWYRDAQAFLHSNFRVNGERKGAVASLHAVVGGGMVQPTDTALFRETAGGEWEPVSAKGRRTSGSDIYRMGDNGPYFRVVRRG